MTINKDDLKKDLTKKLSNEKDVKEELDYVTFTQEVDGKPFEAKFNKKISYLVWKIFFGYVYTQNNYKSATAIIKNQYIPEEGKPDIREDKSIMTLFIGDILGDFVKFPLVNLYKSDNSKEGKKVKANNLNVPFYTLEIGKEVFYIRHLKDDEYEMLFNLVSKPDPLEAWSYVYKEMVIEKTASLDRNSVEFASGHSVPSLLLNIRQSNLKKK